MTTFYTQKAKDMNIEAISIKGVRWFSKTHGKTYHKAYVSALIRGVWQELCQSEQTYGYDDHYIVTACQVLMDAGLIQAESEYGLSNYSIRKELNIETHTQDVKRQKDM